MSKPVPPPIPIPVPPLPPFQAAELVDRMLDPVCRMAVEAVERTYGTDLPPEIYTEMRSLTEDSITAFKENYHAHASGSFLPLMVPFAADMVKPREPRPEDSEQDRARLKEAEERVETLKWVTLEHTPIVQQHLGPSREALNAICLGKKALGDRFEDIFHLDYDTDLILQIRSKPRLMEGASVNPLLALYLALLVEQQKVRNLLKTDGKVRSSLVISLATLELSIVLFGDSLFPIFHAISYFAADPKGENALDQINKEAPFFSSLSKFRQGCEDVENEHPEKPDWFSFVRAIEALCKGVLDSLIKILDDHPTHVGHLQSVLILELLSYQICGSLVPYALTLSKEDRLRDILCNPKVISGATRASRDLANAALDDRNFAERFGSLANRAGKLSNKVLELPPSLT